MQSLKHRCASFTTRFVSALLLIYIGAVLAACSVTEDAGEEASVELVKVGQALPTFSVTTIEGQTVATDSLRGSVAVLCFFNTTCSDCRKTLPALQQLYEEMVEANQSAEKASQSAEKDFESAKRGLKSASEANNSSSEASASAVKFLCISRAQSAADVTAYWEQNALTLPVSAQDDRAVFNLFASRTIPRVYIADATGTVRSVFVEKTSYEEVREALLKAVSP